MSQPKYTPRRGGGFACDGKVYRNGDDVPAEVAKGRMERLIVLDDRPGDSVQAAEFKRKAKPDSGEAQSDGGILAGKVKVPEQRIPHDRRPKT